MSLATRCTACGTAFRVVQDQLKVSEGWVRCGQCSEVFNALEGLFDLERDSTAEESISAAPLDAPTGVKADHSNAHGNTETLDDGEIDAHLFGSAHKSKRRTHAAHISERDQLAFSDARFDSDLLAGESGIDETDDPAAQATRPELPLESVAALEFVRHAENRARWQTPQMHAALASGAAALLIVLALQVGHHFRDLISARWPALQPAFARWCAIAACRLDAPRRIDDITVDSTVLARDPNLDAYRLTVTLRSRSNLPVAMPWIDLSLTDASGKLIARKALATQSFNPGAFVLKPGAEFALQTVFTAGNARFTGYTVEIFYP